MASGIITISPISTSATDLRAASEPNLKLRAALVKHRQEVKLGKRRRVVSPTFSVFAGEFLDTKKHLLSLESINFALDRLVEYFGDIRLNEIQSKDVHKYRTKRRLKE